MRNRYAVRHRPGFALNLFNFILTTVGTTALATASIIAAYQKFVVEPRTPSELTRLQHENSELQSANVRLGREISASAQTRVVRERNLFEAAEAIEVNKTALPAAVKVPYAVRYRGMTPEEIATARHRERVRSAARIVSAAIDDPHSRPDYLDSSAVNELHADLKAVKDEPPIDPVGPHPAADLGLVEPGLDHPAAP